MGIFLILVGFERQNIFPAPSNADLCKLARKQRGRFDFVCVSKEAYPRG